MLNNYLIWIIIGMAILITYNFYQINILKKQVPIVEGLDNAEALSTIASLYNTGNMKITNLEVTGNLKVTGDSNLANANIPGKLTTTKAKIGAWELRGDRIGIPGRADLHLHSDKWCRLLNYDQGTGSYAGRPHDAGGFAGMNLWAHQGRVWSKDCAIGDQILSQSHAETLKGSRPFKLYQTGGTTGGYNVCKSGYVISGGDCKLHSGATNLHKGHWNKPENWAEFVIK